MTAVRARNRVVIDAGQRRRRIDRQTASREIELKFEVAQAPTEWLVHSRRWPRLSQCKSERLSSVYYDTPDFELRECGYALRVRSCGSRFLQTLKSFEEGAGLFDRGEWEDEIEGPEPDVDRLAGTPVRDLHLGALRPVVQTEIERTGYRAAQSGSEVEIDVDVGTVSAANGVAQVSELEIELIRGAPSAALEVARQIAEEIPVKLAVMSKAERGFALTASSLPAWAKAGHVHLIPGMSVAQGLAIIVAACLRHFRLNEPLLIENRNAEALHQTRVAIRRLRSALTLFRSAVEGREFDRIQDELRWFFAESGDARNLDVYLERDLPSEQRQFLEERREDAYDRLIGAMESARFRRLMLDLLGWSVVGEWRKGPVAACPMDDFVFERIDRLWAKVSSAAAVTRMGDRRRHRLRIKVKKLRYALEFVEGLQRLPPRRKRKFEKGLKQLQESLGELHDMVTARSMVALNSWLATPEARSKDQRRLALDADRAMRRLKGLGAYW
jgi:inorganic triphosphatase YgiF